MAFRKTGEKQPSRTAQALTAFHMRGLGVIKVINQRNDRRVSRREHKLRNGRVAKLLVKREAGAGLLKTPWFDMKKKLCDLKPTEEVQEEVELHDANVVITGIESDGKKKRSRKKEALRKSNVEVAKGIQKALKKLRK